MGDGTNQTDGGAEQPQVLAGVRIVELTMWIAGPAAGGILADWGAEVIKVEPPGTGDPQRNVYGTLGYGDIPNPSFMLDNRGKRSVALTCVPRTGSQRSSGSSRRPTCSSRTCDRRRCSGWGSITRR